MDGFLKRHGHRSVMEAEIAAMTLGRRPALRLRDGPELRPRARRVRPAPHRGAPGPRARGGDEGCALASELVEATGLPAHAEAGAGGHRLARAYQVDARARHAVPAASDARAGASAWSRRAASTTSRTSTTSAGRKSPRSSAARLSRDDAYAAHRTTESGGGAQPQRRVAGGVSRTARSLCARPTSRFRTARRCAAFPSRPGA